MDVNALAGLISGGGTLALAVIVVLDQRRIFSAICEIRESNAAIKERLRMKASNGGDDDEPPPARRGTRTGNEERISR